jgi:mRNA-degrading endonuclease RelE of RelBE toxin-antitoxin system
MSFKVELSERAVKDLKRFSKKDLERVFKTIEKLNDPFR